MTDPTLAAERVELVIDIEANRGPDIRSPLFGIAVEYPAGGLPLVTDGPAGEPTSFGRPFLAQVADELDAARSWPTPPTVLVVNRTDPPPWRRQALDDPTVEEAAVVEAAQQLDLAPPPSGYRPTEKAAAAKAAGAVGSARRACLNQFVIAGDAGLTDDELAVALDAIPNRIATRRKELQDEGLVVAAGRYRPTRSGADAIVHRITDLGAATWSLLGGA